MNRVSWVRSGRIAGYIFFSCVFLSGPYARAQEPRGAGYGVARSPTVPPIHTPPFPVDPDVTPSPASGENRAPPVEAASPQGPEGLVKNGPQFPVSRSVGSFVVEGFVRDGWPFVIDFMSKPDSCTWLEVDTDKKTNWSQILDVDGSGERHILKIDVPANLASEPRPAYYSIHSVQHPCTWSAASGAQATRALSPIEVYGIGAGPRAVGSVAVNTLRFGPPTPQFPQELAIFDYLTESDFGRIAQEILEYQQTGEGQWTVVTVRATQLYATVHGPHHGDWDGTALTGKRMPGVYHLQVRAWNTANDEKSWVGAISPDSVHISRP